MLDPGAFGDPKVLFSLELGESSGLAVAGDRLYTVEDGGNPSGVVVLDRQGTVLDRLGADLPNRDTEDLALAPDAAGVPRLWVADVGDNRARRDEVQVRTLALDGSGPVTTYRFVYADGAHDAEALLVLPGGRGIALVTKELAGAGLYTATLGEDVNVLRRVAEVSLPLVTGGAVRPDGGALVLRNYTTLYEYPLAGGNVAAALAQPPTRSRLPTTEQGEAVAYDGEDAVVLSTEGSGGPVHRLTRTAPPEPTALPEPTAAPATPEPGTATDSYVPLDVLLLAAAVPATLGLLVAGLRGAARARRRRQHRQ